MKRFYRTMCLSLVLILVTAPVALAQDISTYSSSYFGAFDTWLEIQPNLRINICFDVVGTSRMDKIGTDKIEIQESTDGVNFTTVDTFYPESFPEMLCENTASHADYVTFYNTVEGRYYRAYTRFYAKKGTGSGVYYDYSPILYVPN